jgi:hypothetical protein
VSELATLLSLDAGANEREVVERCVARLLYEGAVWPSARTSDGVSSYRFVAREPQRARICGWIWSIDQSCAAFWLDIERDRATERVAWNLYFDVDGSTVGAARARKIVDGMDDPSHVAWRVTLSGAE